MRRDRIRLSRRHQGWIFATFAILLVSGVLWLVARKWLGGEGEFGETTSPLAPLSMQVHGAAAMVFLVLLGTLLEGHVRQAWSARRNRWTGGGVLTTVGLLIASGYGLYYLAGETTREVISVLHWALGLVAPLLLAWHVRASRRVRAGRIPRSRRRRTGPSAGPPPSEPLAAGPSSR